MRDDQKTKADLLQELNTLRERVSGHNRPAEEWSKIFDATSDIVFVQDKDFKVIKVNKSACDVLKVKPEDLIGKSVTKFYINPTSPGQTARWQRL